MRLSLITGPKAQSTGEIRGAEEKGHIRGSGSRRKSSGKKRTKRKKEEKGRK